MRVDAHIVTQQITALMMAYPEISDDIGLQLGMLEGETDLFEFMRQIEKARRDATAMAGATATSIADLELRLRRFERREKAMRELAFKLMQFAKLTKHEMPEATYSIRNVPPSVLITDEDALPDHACKFTRRPDKTKLKELLEHDSIPGATMSNGATTLSIRTR